MAQTSSESEIEIRGKFSKKDFIKIKALLDKNGISNHYTRLSVDLSPGFNVKTRSWSDSSLLDLRVKKSGINEKISVKIGKLHSKKRIEIDTQLKDGEILNAVLLLEALGFSKGTIYLWKSWEYNYKGFLVKLSKYRHNYYTWEIESSSSNLNPSELAKKLDLHPFTKKEYNHAVNWENKNIHRLYSFKTLKRLLN